MKKFLWLALLLILLAAAVFAVARVAGMPEEVDRAIALIAKANELHHGGVGVGGERTEIYHAMEAVRKGTSGINLWILLNHRSPAVRAYAFILLAERYPHGDLWPIIRSRLRDEATYMEFSGCIRNECMVAETMLLTARRRLSQANRQYVFSYLLNKPNGLWKRPMPVELAYLFRRRCQFTQIGAKRQSICRQAVGI